MYVVCMLLCQLYENLWFERMNVCMLLCKLYENPWFNWMNVNYVSFMEILVLNEWMYIM